MRQMKTAKSTRGIVGKMEKGGNRGDGRMQSGPTVSTGDVSAVAFFLLGF